MGGGFAPWRDAAAPSHGMAFAQFLTARAQATSTHHEELASINRQLRENAAAADRYLSAFERGTLDDEDPDVQARLTNLWKQSKQLRADKARLEFDLDQPPAGPSPEDLATIRSQIAEIITTGGHKAKKALFEALIEDIEILTDDSGPASASRPPGMGKGWP